MRGILLDENGNIVVNGGHLQIADNSQQLCEQLLAAFTSEYKHEPLLGGNAKKMIAGSADPFWAGNVKKQLQYCNVEVNQINIVNDDIIIELK